MPDNGLNLVHALAKRKAEKMYTDMMASGGASSGQIAKEVTYFMPSELMDAYEQLWYQGTAGKDDGGSGLRGSSQAEAGLLGKAATANEAGKIFVGGGGSAKRKSYKKYWFVADEEALEIKDRADKRLRAVARDIKDQLEALNARRAGIKKGNGAGEEGTEGAAGSAGVEEVVRPRCEGCGRLIGEGWKFCSSCGYRVTS